MTRTDRLLTFFGIERAKGEYPTGEVFPMGKTPIIRLVRSGDPLAPTERIVDDALFRFVPEFVTAQGWAKNTFNARSEEVTQKATYKKAWADGHRCIIPVEWFFEPRYPGTVERPGKSERWRIQQPGGVPLGVAGIYRTYQHPTTGELVFTVSMLTVNAEAHPVCHQFHKPGDEKRMPVILDREDYGRWLSCSPTEAQAMCKQWHGPLEAFPDRITRRVPSGSASSPRGPGTEHGLL